MRNPLDSVLGTVTSGLVLTLVLVGLLRILVTA
jgi:hypothetical protein